CHAVKANATTPPITIRDCSASLRYWCSCVPPWVSSNFGYHQTSSITMAGATTTMAKNKRETRKRAILLAVLIYRDSEFETAITRGLLGPHSGGGQSAGEKLLQIHRPFPAGCLKNE